MLDARCSMLDARCSYRYSSFLGLCLALLLSVTADAADLAEIRETLRERETSFGSIRMTYVLRSGLAFDCEYVESGSAKRLKMSSPEIGEEVFYFDGEFGWQSLHRPGEDHIDIINKTNAEPTGLRNPLTPLTWFGMPLTGARVPLHEALEKATITGESTFDGQPVVDVDLGEWNPTLDRPIHVTARLSSNHDYLPVFVSVTPVDPEAGGSPYENVVKSFRQIRHPLLNRPIWFPEVMTSRSNEVELMTLEVNPEVPPQAFVPVPDDGTKIADRTGPGEPRVTIHGGKNIRERIMTRAEEEPVPPLPGSGIVADPPDSGVSGFYWMAVALVAFGAAGVYWKMR